MTHLARVGALLLAVLLFVFVGFRVLPTPAFLVNFGFHNKNNAGNMEAWASLPLQYAQSSTCQSCHQDNYGLWVKGNHKTVSCENCHGPAKAHLETGAPETLDTSRELCGSCHARLVSRPSDFPQVDMETMGG